MPEPRTPARAVAEWLLAYRADHELTQTQLAARLGLHAPALAAYEQGMGADVSLLALRGFAEGLGVDLNVTLSADRECDVWSCR